MFEVEQSGRLIKLSARREKSIFTTYGDQFRSPSQELLGDFKSASSADDVLDNFNNYDSHMFSINRELSRKLDLDDVLDSRLKSLEKNYQKIIASPQDRYLSDKAIVTTVFEPENIS